MNKLTPLAKGLITAVVMLGLTLFIFYSNQPADSKLNYLVFVLYVAGIVWTLIEFHRFVNPAAKFSELFGQGFRCFIVITFIMVAFTGIFSAAHPEFAENDAKNYREYLDKEVKDKTPAEKDEMAANAKKHYTTGLVYSAIFGYLIIGSIATAAGSVIILLRRK
jgi:glycerol uptake facilitator-like aquaporin